MAYAYVLRCFGSPSLFTAAGEQVRFRTRKHLALLVRMALDPDKLFTRDYLADLLWPAAPPKLANHSLAQGLSVIKAKVAREAVVIHRATVGLAAGWVDVDVHHLASNEAAIDGPFLDAFDVAARPFEDWKDEYRARLMPQVRDWLVRQMDASRRVGDFAAVERRAVRLQELDPLAEEGIRGTMEARAWASDRSSALKAFARYEAQLAEELGAKPSADLIRMADLLRDGRRSPPRPAAHGAPVERVDRRFEPETLIGREREFSVLYDAWLEARRKSPRIVVVTSDPGVGKTTLVNAFASSCQMDGAVVARAQAYDAERELPFAVLGELVRQLATQRAIGSADPEALSELTRISAEILRAFPGVPKPVEWSPELTPLRIADALLKTVMAAATDSPMVLVVDDIHAADNASTAILHSVARKLADTRVLFILTGRTSELRLSGAPWSLSTDATIAGMRPLELDVLSPEAAEQLITRLVAGATRPDPPVERIRRASGGNPLAIELLSREWAAHGAASLLRDLEALDTQPVPTIGIPRAIGAVFERQSRRLEPTIRATLDLAAVLGRRLTEVGLYAAIELSPGQAAEALSRLRDEGYLREVRGDLEFRNELIRAQAYYAVAATTRHHLHRRVAALLSGHQSLEDKAINLEIAWHLLRGGDAGRAVPYALEGSEAVLAVGAPHGAQEILSAIVDLEADPSNRRKILLLLAKALIDQSKAEPALPIIEELTSSHELSVYEQAEVAMLRASAEFTLNPEAGAKYCDVAKLALLAAKRTGDGGLISRALFECARAGTEEGIPELVRVAEHGVEELGMTLDIRAKPMALLTKAFCKLFSMDPQGGLSLLQRLLDVSRRDANAAQMSFFYSGVGIASHFLCRFDDAFDAFTTALDLSRRVGDDARTSLLASNLCLIQVARGDYDHAISFGKMAVALGGASSSSSLSFHFTNLSDAYVLVGDEAAAVECMRRAREWLVPRRRWKLHCGFLIESAAFALIRGNASLALDLTGQLESIAKDREDAVPIPGSYWKLKIFREATLGRITEAENVLQLATRKFQNSCPYYYLDIVGAKAWLETTVSGQIRPETALEIQLFDKVGAVGRKALLTAQGFLKPKLVRDLMPSGASLGSEQGTGSLGHRQDVGSQQI